MQADYLISAFSTNVARLAYELMVARHGHYVPFVSVEGVLHARLQRLVMVKQSMRDLPSAVLRVQW